MLFIKMNILCMSVLQMTFTEYLPI